MKLKNVWIAVLGAFVIAASCNNNTKSAIKGSIEGAAGKTVYLERFINNRGVITDSTVIGQDGKFVLVPGQPLDMNFYRLMLNDRDFVVLIIDSTETIDLKGKAGDLNMGAQVEGSNYTTALRDFESACKRIYTKEEEAMKKAASAGSPEEQASLRQQATDARKELNAYIKTWLESNSATPPALAAVQMLDIRTELETYKRVVADLEKSFAQSLHYKMLKQKVDNAGKPDPRTMPNAEPNALISVGAPAPEIALPDPSGKTRKLSDLKGKVVLIDFWASWCGPCRRENPNVVSAYNKYKKDGFEVMSVSLDKDGNAWKQAIAQDGLIWDNHVSDLKFWQSKAAADYGVHSIPFPVLVDKEGKVIAYGPNVRGELLEANLKQIFGR